MNILLKLIAHIVKSHIDEEKEKSFREGKFVGANNKENERLNENIEIQMFEIKKHIGGNPVIILSNEWCNPIVAEIQSVEYDKGVVYKVFDYLTGEIMYGSNTVMPFTIQKLKAIGKLSPNEIVALFFEGKFGKNEIFKTENPATIDSKFYRTNYIDWIEKMKNNGFFDKYPQYKDGLNKD